MKKFTHLFIFSLLTLLFLSTGQVWGNTWTIKVGIGTSSVGHGEAYAEGYNDPITGTIWMTETQKATTTTLKTATWNSIASTTEGYCVYTATAYTGYHFDGWYTNAACTAGEIKSNPYEGPHEGGEWGCTRQVFGVCTKHGYIDASHTYTYYAKFSPNSYDVTLNANGGVGSDQTVSATYDAAMPTVLKNTTTAITKPTMAGYSFLGYYDAQSGGKQYYDKDLKSANKWDKTPTETVTLYAHWQENAYTITWPTIESGLVYTPGAQVQDHFATTGSAVDGTTTVAGTFTCSEELQPALNSTGYTVTFTPTNTNKYLSHTTTIKQDVAKADQYITWDLQDGLDPKSKYYEYAEGEAFGATSYRLNTTTATNLTVTYESSDNSIATVDGNSLRVHTVGQVVTITAKQTGNDNWNAATQVSKTFKTCGVKPNTFNVSATNLTYGQFLSASTLTGTVSVNSGSAIPGTLTWVEPETFPSAGANQTFDVLFTPEKTDVFGSVIFPVTINVAKADPELTWKIGHSIRELSTYNNFVSSSNATAGTLHITTSSDSLLPVTNQTLNTGDVESATAGWIKVSQDETANFNALPEQTWNVTINPKSNVCLPITSMNADVFAQTYVSGVGNVQWNNEEYILANISDNVHLILNFLVTPTQAIGIQLGSWEDGFTGLNISDCKYSEKSVVLTFNGSPETISFDVETQYIIVTKLTGIGKFIPVPYPATCPDWSVAESADGVNFTQVGGVFNSDDVTSISRSLKADTRYVKITYTGNFGGYVKNLQITKRAATLTADKNSLTFGTNNHPLQEPQTVTINYGTLGSCGQTGAITASIEGEGSSAFYLDETNITDNVGFDYNGTYTVRVRCNDVGKSATLRFRAFDGTEKTVSLTSTTPELISAGSTIFQTGTEHVAVPGSAYRTKTTINYTQCFNGSEAIFDTLYLYGVSESSAANRLWEYDAVKEYNVPALNVAAGNVYTPCFVYKKNNNKYEYARTCDATKLLNISAAGKKLGFIGYRPASTATAANAIQLNGAAGERTDVYLNNTEIVANGVVLKTNSSSDAEPFEVVLHARGTNTLSANAAAVQLSAKAQLTIEDSWKSDAASGILALKPAANYPSIDLGGANTVIVNGSQLELHNATNMAIAHMSGATELTDGAVRINDGTITGEAILGMPQNTLIDGGTFNEGNVVCYNDRGKTVRPLNSRKEIVSRQTMTMSDLEANYAWYGRAHLTLVGANVHPMLFGGEGICIFNAYEDVKSDKDINWTTTPAATSDAIVEEDMEVIGNLTVNSLTINEGKTVTVKEGATLTIGDGDSYYENVGNLHVEKGGNVILSTGQLNVNNFYLDAQLGITDQTSTSASASGQVKNEHMLHVSGDAYFNLAVDPSGQNTLGWYDFVVPFEVDVIGGISIAEAPEVPMQFNVNYAVMDYTEAKRAVNGKDWNKFRGTMQPGRVYTITLDETQPWNTVVFKKKAGAAVTGDRSFTTEFSGLGAAKDNGWNGFGNGSLHHAELNAADGTFIQLYDHAHRCYQTREAQDYSIAVGLSFFIQVNGVKTITLDVAEGNTLFRAPARDAREIEHFRLALTKENEDKASDYLWVSANEEATGEYMIGKDVLKMGSMTESKVARMWSERNGVKLCSNDMPMTAFKANGELGLFAPKAGVYSIAVEKAPADATLFLTYQGKVIWNLSMSPYEFNLEQGTTEGYGLRIVAEREVTTDIENAEVDGTQMRKVLIDNTMYIITPEGAMYDVTGKSIK